MQFVPESDKIASKPNYFWFNNFSHTPSNKKNCRELKMRRGKKSKMDSKQQPLKFRPALR
jgi:hypothetical protein